MQEAIRPLQLQADDAGRFPGPLQQVGQAVHVGIEAVRQQQRCRSRAGAGVQGAGCLQLLARREARIRDAAKVRAIQAQIKIERTASVCQRLVERPQNPHREVERQRTLRQTFAGDGANSRVQADRRHDAGGALDQEAGPKRRAVGKAAQESPLLPRGADGDSCQARQFLEQRDAVVRNLRTLGKARQVEADLQKHAGDAPIKPLGQRDAGSRAIEDETDRFAMQRLTQQELQLLALRIVAKAVGAQMPGQGRRARCVEDLPAFQEVVEKDGSFARHEVVFNRGEQRTRLMSQRPRRRLRDIQMQLHSAVRKHRQRQEAFTQMCCQGGVRMDGAEPFGAFDDPGGAAAGTPIVERGPPGQIGEAWRFHDEARQRRRRRQAAQTQQPLAERRGDIARENGGAAVRCQAVGHEAIGGTRAVDRYPSLRLRDRLPPQLGVAPCQGRLADFADYLCDFLGDFIGRGNAQERILAQEVNDDIGQLADQERAGRPQRLGSGVQRLADAVGVKRRLAAVALLYPHRQIRDLVGHAVLPSWT